MSRPDAPAQMRATCRVGRWSLLTRGTRAAVTTTAFMQSPVNCSDTLASGNGRGLFICHI
jgi:hypothetical protein